jgi:hypothetical protein
MSVGNHPFGVPQTGRAARDPTHRLLALVLHHLHPRRPHTASLKKPHYMLEGPYRPDFRPPSSLKFVPEDQYQYLFTKEQSTGRSLENRRSGIDDSVMKRRSQACSLIDPLSKCSAGPCVPPAPAEEHAPEPAGRGGGVCLHLSLRPAAQSDAPVQVACARSSSGRPTS